VNKERRLGRGLEALLGRGPEEGGDGGGEPHGETAHDHGPRPTDTVNVYEIERNPFQPRRDFDEDEIRALAESIKQHGLIQPLVVRRQGDRFQLVAGERRLRAAIKSGWSEVPVRMVEADDRQLAELALIENLQRKDLNTIEKAVSFQGYLERFECTQEDLATRLDVDRSTVANLIRLLELPDDVQEAVRRGAITQGHARALLPLGDPHEQISFCRRIQAEELSVRMTEEYVRLSIELADHEPLDIVRPELEDMPQPAPRPRGELLRELEQTFRTSLGTKVDVRQTVPHGRGRIVIHFRGQEEFDRLLRQLCPTYEQSEHQRAG